MIFIISFHGWWETTRNSAGTGCLMINTIIPKFPHFTPSPTTLMNTESAICALYLHPKISQVNMVRNAKWNRPTKDITQLFPCHDSALLHIRCANYQSAIWRRCLEAQPFTPTPKGYGWIIEDGVLSILWMTQARVPKVVLQSVGSCHRNSVMACRSRNCSCNKKKSSCNSRCGCEGGDGCYNSVQHGGENDSDPE